MHVCRRANLPHHVIGVNGSAFMFYRGLRVRGRPPCFTFVIQAAACRVHGATTRPRETSRRNSRSLSALDAYIAFGPVIDARDLIRRGQFRRRPDQLQSAPLWSEQRFSTNGPLGFSRRTIAVHLGLRFAAQAASRMPARASIKNKPRHRFVDGSVQLRAHRFQDDHAIRAQS